MTIQEKQEVTAFLDAVFKRINDAKEHIRQSNYGLALKTLSGAYPQLKLKVDE